MDDAADLWENDGAFGLDRLTLVKKKKGAELVPQYESRWMEKESQ